MTRRTIALLVVAILSCSDVSAFVIPQRRLSHGTFLAKSSSGRQTPKLGPQLLIPVTAATTSLHMGFSLPPSGGGGKRDDVSELVGGVVTVVAIVAFFASPLGGIFFSVVNSFFLLTLLTPVLLFVAFQAWQTFNTIEGPCPNCDAPVRVLKDPLQPTICLNCGAFVQSNANKNGIDYSPQNDVLGNNDDESLDSLFGGWRKFGGQEPVSKERQESLKRKQTVIDVEVEKED